MQQLWSLLGDSWRFFTQHFTALLLLLLPLMLPLELFNAIALANLAAKPQLLGVTASLNVFSIIAYQCLAILYIGAQISGKTFTIKEYYQQSMPHYFALFLLYLLSGFAALAGLFMFIIPGLIVIARLSFSEYYCVLDKLKPLEAFKQSWQDTKDYQWPLLLGTVLVSILSSLPTALLDYLLSSMELNLLVNALVVGIISAMLMLPLTVFKYRYLSYHREQQNQAYQAEQAVDNRTDAPILPGNTLRYETASPGDHTAILAVHQLAFAEQGKEIATLVSDLRTDVSAEPSYSFVAKDGEKIIAHLLFTKISLEHCTYEQALNAQILAPMAVHPDYQKQGIGQTLVNYGLEQLRAAGVELVFVLGHTGFYPKCGFRPAAPHELSAPHPIPEEHSDAWMVLQLSGDSLGQFSAQVKCAEVLNAPEHW